MLRQDDTVVAIAHKTNNTTTLKHFKSAFSSLRLDVNRHYVDMAVTGTDDHYLHKADPLVNYEWIAPFENAKVGTNERTNHQQRIRNLARFGWKWLNRDQGPPASFGYEH